ncbi:MAG: hypothetical protein ACI956_002625, partial [Nonlabens sp.]
MNHALVFLTLPELRSFERLSFFFPTNAARAIPFSTLHSRSAKQTHKNNLQINPRLLHDYAKKNTRLYRPHL